MDQKAKRPFTVLNADGSVSVKLLEPVVFGEEKIEDLKIQKPRAKHVRGVNLRDMKMDDMLALLSKLTGQFPQALDELCMPDVVCCMGVIESFFQGSDGVGKT